MDKKQQAQTLYMQGGKTQKEIAAEVGVSERTIYTWVHQFAWDRLRLAAVQAPVIIADNLASQIVELQHAISAREPGKRYPSPQEAEVLRKLINAWEKMKKYPSQSQSMQVLETFRNYIRPVDKDFARSLAKYTERFLAAKSINGFEAYEVEYGVDPVSPISAFYDEATPDLPAVAGDEPQEPEEQMEVVPVQCPDADTCNKPGNCTYPQCRFQRTRPRPKPPMEDAYKVPLMHYRPQKPEAAGSNIPWEIGSNKEEDLTPRQQFPVAAPAQDSHKN